VVILIWLVVEVLRGVPLGGAARHFTIGEWLCERWVASGAVESSPALAGRDVVGHRLFLPCLFGWMLRSTTIEYPGGPDLALLPSSLFLVFCSTSLRESKLTWDPR
jgi:hypothetical protein